MCACQYHKTVRQNGETNALRNWEKPRAKGGRKGADAKTPFLSIGSNPVKTQRSLAENVQIIDPTRCAAECFKRETVRSQQIELKRADLHRRRLYEALWITD